MTTQSPPPGQLLTTDDQLDSKRKLMGFNLERIGRYTALVLGILLSAAILTVVIYMLCTEQTWREYAITAVFNGLPGIIIAILAIVGIKTTKG